MVPKSKFSISTKLSLVLTSLVLATLVAVIFAVRQTVVARFTEQYENTVNTNLKSLRAEFKSRRTRIQQQLQQLSIKLVDDYEFRLQVLVLNKTNDPFIVDYAGAYMTTMGLDVLEIANSERVVLSSGHDRNAFGMQRKQLVKSLSSDDSIKLSRFKTEGQPLICVAAVDSVLIGNSRFYITGGTKVDTVFLSALTQKVNGTVVVQLPDTLLSTVTILEIEPLLNSLTNDKYPKEATFTKSGYTIGRFELPFIGQPTVGLANIFLFHPRTELTHLLTSLNTNIIAIAVAGLIIAIILAIWVAHSVTKPLRRLTALASTLSLDKLNAKFETAGNDEVGVLNGALSDMQRRLRYNRIKLAAAEKKAAFAQIARQVNHDIKNGFLPIRNVMRHWQEVAESEPEKLADIFIERKMSILDSIAYLEELARGYSRLKPETKISNVSINELLEHICENYRGISGANVGFEIALEPGNPLVRADRVQLQRAFENVLHNALDAVDSSGVISVRTHIEKNDVHITFRDNGIGIPAELQERLFQPHVTTKINGTGLGLSNVKSIVADFGGRVTIKSAAGNGTTVVLCLPKIAQTAT